MAGCSSTDTASFAEGSPAGGISSGAAGSAQPRLAAGEAALRAGRADLALREFGDLLRQDPSNGYLQFLYALSYHTKARQGDGASWELARVGYRSALRFAPSHYWSALFAAVLEFERRNFRVAQELFAQAIINDPDRHQAYLGLAHASYFAGDLVLADAAIRKTLVLMPSDATALSLGTLIAAASAKPAEMETRLAQLSATHGEAVAAPVRARASSLARTSVLDRATRRRVSWSSLPSEQSLVYRPDVLPAQFRTVAAGIDEQTFSAPEIAAPPLFSAEENLSGGLGGLSSGSSSLGAFGSSFGGGLGFGEEKDVLQSNPEGPNQVMVDLTIILDSKTSSIQQGINLLDGLQLQYGYTNELRSVDGESLRTITQLIAIPEISYNLNLFNAAGQSYQVLARPSLTAHYQRESQFFAGRTINVQTSGVNVASIEPIDIGVSLKVTPERITEDFVTFKVNAGRSFLSQEVVGSFDQSLTTYKQAVSATATVEFGQTLILSGLSENVLDAQTNKVPVVGDVPVVNTFFREKRDLQREDSVLILVTPVPPMQFQDDAAAQQRSEAVNKLVQVWKEWIDPQSDLSKIVARLQEIWIFQRAEPTDGNINVIFNTETVKEALGATAASVS